MSIMIKSLMMIMSITFIIVILITTISKKTLSDMQKLTPFECGFNPMSYSRLPFSIHFFLIAVIFLIFDIEIILVMPMIITMKTSTSKFWIITSTSFLIILLMGLFHEWKNGMINWSK
uniref:NADH dehydrogenase subunit 3 n=1 Tax=Doratura stylata TaxID=139543 RepID=UPI00202911F5|nr:NADH dehydrogenase subunit 3 [Doratura stylata]UPU95802.1 NADH dehydrogenase subunit 3 [Doratura stylata]UXD78645.1 NADH dehydrogenase subunit 3 [Doratura stylata]